VAFDVEMRSVRSPEALERLKADVGALIDRIEAERVWAPHESALCDWCPYWDLCAVKKHLVKVEALPRDEWKDEPGVVIVDAYAERWKRKKELEGKLETVKGEMEGLRDAAIAFAEKEGVQVIAGTESRLRVTGKDRIVSPAKGTGEREALERELRARGVWDEVAELDTSALDKAIAAGKWSGDILEALKAYVRIEKRWTVSLREED